MNYILSPEFHRHIWLRFSPFRLLAAPVLLGLCVMIASGASERHFPGALENLSRFIFFVTVIVWGTYEAGTALQEEVRGNTWDFQRMSAITPAQLALGKLFGATSYTWYFGLLSLLLFAFSHEAPAVSRGVEPGTMMTVFYMAMAGLVGQALAFLIGFVDMVSFPAKTGKLRVPRGTGAFLVGFFAAAWIFGTIAGAEEPGRGRRGIFDPAIRWFGEAFDRDAFLSASLLFFLGWFLVGSYRIARTELMHRNLPFVWIGFVVTFSAWWAGLVYPRLPKAEAEGLMTGPAVTAFALSAVVAYGAMLVEAADSRRYARFFTAARAGDVQRALESVPKWLACVPVVLLFCFVALAVSQGMQGLVRGENVGAFMFSLMLFMIRDGCAIHAIHRSIRGRSASFAILFYYVVAYGLLPALSFTTLRVDLSDIFRALETAAVPEKVSGTAGLFFPTGFSAPAASVFPALLQALVAAGILVLVLRRKP